MPTKKAPRDHYSTPFLDSKLASERSYSHGAQKLKKTKAKKRGRGKTL
jgi:hypothetical protein